MCFYAELYKAQKDKPGPSFIWGCFRMVLCRTVQGAKRQAWTKLFVWGCLEWFYLCRIVWFYAELYTAQNDKPGPSFVLGLFRMVLSMQNCVVLCRTVQGTKRQAWTKLCLGLFRMVLSLQNCVVLCRTVQGTKRQAWTKLHLGLF